MIGMLEEGFEVHILRERFIEDGFIFIVFRYVLVVHSVFCPKLTEVQVCSLGNEEWDRRGHESGLGGLLVGVLFGALGHSWTLRTFWDVLGRFVFLSMSHVTFFMTRFRIKSNPLFASPNNSQWGKDR